MAKTIMIDGPEGPLAGEATAVEGARHVVVIIPGSGPVDRDGNGPQGGLDSNAYKMLADELAEAGIASIRIDKRGLFDSSAAIADPNDVTIEAYAGDVRDWVKRAAEMAPCVWIAGHSEGGLVALVASRKPPEPLCGLLLLSTAGRPMGELLREQLRAMPGMAPSMPAIDRIVTGLEAGRTADPDELPPHLKAIFSPGLQRYMIDLFSHDPVALAHDWQGPALIVQGDADIQVKPMDADLLAEALPQAEKVVLEGATHMLKVDAPGQPLATYTDPSHPLHPGLVPAISGFLARN
ncbi:alpha/beta hydrolase [Flavimaribacter sediminis]|nr:lysophospholipase [Flavimaribacter sediminis]